MTGAERGFLLLTSSFGDPARKPLTKAQFRTLAARARRMEPEQGDRALTLDDLLKIGCAPDTARRILELLSQEDRLDSYLAAARRQECRPVTWAHGSYPSLLRRRLGDESPGCLWAKGALSILDSPAVGVVGSRNASPESLEFAREAGRQAARQGFTLISGNARGVDIAAQEACLEAGGKVIAVVADCLQDQKARENCLYLSEECFDSPFSPRRALSRNRVIHAMGRAVLAVQPAMGEGGTWDGCINNLRSGRSPVFCFADGSEASMALEKLGAELIPAAALCCMKDLFSRQCNLFDQ